MIWGVLEGGRFMERRETNVSCALADEEDCCGGLLLCFTGGILRRPRVDEGRDSWVE